MWLVNQEWCLGVQKIEKSQKKHNILWDVNLTWNSDRSVFVNEVLLRWSHSFVYCLWLLSRCSDRGEQRWQAVRLAKPEVLVWLFTGKLCCTLSCIIGQKSPWSGRSSDCLSCFVFGQSLRTKCLESRPTVRGGGCVLLKSLPAWLEPLNLCDVLPCSLWSMLVRVDMHKVSYLLLGTLSKWHINCNKCK